MSFTLHRGGFPGIAAGTIADRSVVGLHTAGERAVVALATDNVEPFGVVETGAASGAAVTVYEPGSVVEVIAGASVAHGNRVAVGSGGLVPIAGASGTANYQVGRAVSAANPGGIFSVYVSPKQLGGLA